MGTRRSSVLMRIKYWEKILRYKLNWHREYFMCGIVRTQKKKLIGSDKNWQIIVQFIIIVDLYVNLNPEAFIAILSTKKNL
jgi:hypothetical protein